MRWIVTSVAMLGVAASAAVAQVQTKAPLPVVRSQVTAETVAQGLAHPWGLAFLPDGRMLVTERPGRLRIVARDGALSPPVVGVPIVAAQNQGGLLDILVDPKFAENRTIFFTYAEPRGAGSNGTAVARARLVETDGAGRLENLTVIFRQEPSFSGGLHFGSRLALSDDGYLFVTLGERFQRDRAQELNNHYGKVVRIFPDGRVPPDNPFVGRQDAKPEIWSFGHRNPQSAGFHPITRRLWVVEHGARGGDEVNWPERGKNYGWPIITYGIDYSGLKIGIGTAREGLEQPRYYWDPSIAPSGIAFYTGVHEPWRGNMFVGALAKQHLARLVLNAAGAVIAEEQLLGDLNERIRDVRMGPDGALYVLTDSREGRILRVVPR